MTIRSLLKSMLAVFAAFMLCNTAFAQDKVVYHMDDAASQATKGLRNIRNHLDVAPDTKITVVTHANGVDFLMEGAKDAKNPDINYGALVSALKARGVKFEICEITLKNRNLKKTNSFWMQNSLLQEWCALVDCKAKKNSLTSSPDLGCLPRKKLNMVELFLWSCVMRFSRFLQTVHGQSTCGGSRWCLHRFHTVWHRATSDPVGSR